ncbi:MAG: tRNA 2-thiouridine(34) synthase MnmA [Patescibacteria group bacterium]|nr:tRNA 2-thiouridine(34) synthase MnmA [Patescibacteria group bacterium]
MKKIKKQKVAVLMSGGVDSSVSALLLNNKYEVLGLHLKISKFCNPQDELDARLVAEKLNFPIYTLDISEDYQKTITLETIKEYSVGFTPNPDVLCNSKIKFGLVLEFIKKLNISQIATGHYAKIINFNNQKLIAVAKDVNKDQTYFLWQISKKNIKNIIFPIGNYLKSEVREIAFRNNFPNSFKKDSQGICFLGKIKLSDFLKEYLPIYKGIIKDSQGKIIGYHSGYYFFTEGQRHGLNINRANGPYYLALKDKKKNILIVAKEGDDLLFTSRIKLKKINILVSNEIFNKVVKDKNLINVLIRCRYRQPLIRAKFDLKNKIVEFEEPLKNIALGQSAVFYLEGGEIDDSLKNEIILLGGGIIIKKYYYH